MGVFSDKKTSKNICNFYCNFCHFGCSRKGDWTRHLLRLKHLKLTQGDASVTQKTSTYICDLCDKHYSSRNGLWKHKQKCSLIDNETNIDNQNNEHMYNGINIKDKDALVLHLLKQNSELQNKIIGIASQTNITNNNNTTNNIDNKTFNLQVFLNETCKDAMNITDFVNSIKLSLEDLEHTGRQGYIQGISNIIIKNLNNLEQHMRPLHCSNFKKEVLYIKNNNEWLKDSENKPMLTKAIKTIANENIKQINKWRVNYPDCTDSDSIKNDLYLKIVSNSMNGTTKEECDKNINKIISNIAKKVVIEK